MKIARYQTNKEPNTKGRFYFTFTITIDGQEVTLGTTSFFLNNAISYKDPKKDERRRQEYSDSPFDEVRDIGETEVEKTIKGDLRSLLPTTGLKVSSLIPLFQRLLSENYNSLTEQAKEPPKKPEKEARLSDEEDNIDESENLSLLEGNKELEEAFDALEETNSAMAPLAAAIKETKEDKEELAALAATAPVSPASKPSPSLEKLFASAPVKKKSEEVKLELQSVPENFKFFSSEHWEVYWKVFESEPESNSNPIDAHFNVCKKLKIQIPISRDIAFGKEDEASKAKLKDFHETAARVPPEEYRDVFQNFTSKTLSLSLDDGWIIFWKYVDHKISSPDYNPSTILQILQDALLRLGFTHKECNANKQYILKAHQYAENKAGKDLKNPGILEKYKSLFSHYMKASLPLKNHCRDAIHHPIKKLEKFGPDLIPQSISDRYGKEHSNIVEGYKKAIFKIVALREEYTEKMNEEDAIASLSLLNDLLLKDEAYKYFTEVFFYYLKIQELEDPQDEKIVNFKSNENITIQGVQLLTSLMATYEEIIKANTSLENTDDTSKLESHKDQCAKIINKMNEHQRKLEMLYELKPLAGGKGGDKKKETSTENINEKLNEIKNLLTGYTLNSKSFEKIAELKSKLPNLIELLIKKIENKSEKKSTASPSDIYSLFNNFFVLTFFSTELATHTYDPKPHLERINAVISKIKDKIFPKKEKKEKFQNTWTSLQSAIEKFKENKEKQLAGTRASIVSLILPQKPIPLFAIEDASDTLSTTSEDEEEKVEPSWDEYWTIFHNHLPENPEKQPNFSEIRLLAHQEAQKIGDLYDKTLLEKLDIIADWYAQKNIEQGWEWYQDKFQYYSDHTEEIENEIQNITRLRANKEETESKDSELAGPALPPSLPLHSSEESKKKAESAKEEEKKIEHSSTGDVIPIVLVETTKRESPLLPPLSLKIPSSPPLPSREETITVPKETQELKLVSEEDENEMLKMVAKAGEAQKERIKKEEKDKAKSAKDETPKKEAEKKNEKPKDKDISLDELLARAKATEKEIYGDNPPEPRSLARLEFESAELAKKIKQPAPSYTFSWDDYWKEFGEPTEENYIATHNQAFHKIFNKDWDSIIDLLHSSAKFRADTRPNKTEDWLVFYKKEFQRLAEMSKKIDTEIRSIQPIEILLPIHHPEDNDSDDDGYNPNDEDESDDFGGDESLDESESSASDLESDPKTTDWNWDVYWKTFFENHRLLGSETNFSQRTLAAHKNTHRQLFNHAGWEAKLLDDLHFIASYRSPDSAKTNQELWKSYRENFEVFYKNPASIKPTREEIERKIKEKTEVAERKKEEERRQALEEQMKRQEAEEAKRKKNIEARKKKETEEAEKLKKEKEALKDQIQPDKEVTKKDPVTPSSSTLFSQTTSHTTTSGTSEINFLEQSSIDIYKSKKLLFQPINTTHGEIKPPHNPNNLKIDVYKDKMSVDVPNGKLSSETEDLLKEMADAVMAAIDAKSQPKIVWVKGSNTDSVDFLTKYYISKNFTVTSRGPSLTQQNTGP